MRRPQPENSVEPGQDSFLDIVANIVGILIILVMVAGLRIRDATVDAAMADDDLRGDTAALEEEQSTAGLLRSDVFKAAAQVQRLTRERALRQAERDRLATAVAAWEHKIRAYRDELDAESQRAYDLRLELAEAKAQLENTRQETAAAEDAKVPTVVVESYPTPLSKSVDGREAHFQLRGGRVAFIPLEDLLREFKDDARQKASKLLRQPEMTETVGPKGGFRLQYTLVRREIADDTAIAAGRAGTYATLERWTLIPTSGQVGEPVDTALEIGSRFREVLAQHDPQCTTVTLWTYPDSFEEFRRLKKDLYELGYAAAGRPLPFDLPIGGSPQGTKSAAE